MVDVRVGGVYGLVDAESTADIQVGGVYGLVDAEGTPNIEVGGAYLLVDALLAIPMHVGGVYLLIDAELPAPYVAEDDQPGTPTVEVWIEDAAGNKLGSGPIMSAQGITQTDRLNGAGEFAFQVPTLDPQAAQIRAYRWARFWHFDTYGGWQQVGYGRIERITNNINADGAAILSVTGVNELGALADRICNNLSLTTRVQLHPTKAIYVGALPGQGDVVRPEWVDYQPGDELTYWTRDNEGVMGGFEIQSDRAFDTVSFKIPEPAVRFNWNIGGMILEGWYWDTADVAWTNLDTRDNTQPDPDGGGDFHGDNFSLQRSGDITFTPPDTWGPDPISGMYAIRLLYQEEGGGWSFLETGGWSISDISIWRTEPIITPLATVMAYAPAGWGLDTADGYAEVQARALGAELLTDGGFEEKTGTADDATTDAWDHWTVSGANGTAQALVVTSAYTGSYAVKLVNAGVRCCVYQVVNVTAGQEYTLSFLAKGDGARELGYQVMAGSYAGTYEFITSIVDCGITAATWTEITYAFIAPVGYTQVTVLFWGPESAGAAYVDAASLKPGGGGAVYLQLRDETVLQALTRIAQASSQNFILSPGGKKVLWLGRDMRDSELRAIAASANSPDLVGSANVLLLVNLTENEDASQLVSRVYPYGGGMGAERVTLNEVTIPAPTGYTLSKTSNYLQRTAAVTTLGTIEAVQSWSDILPADPSPTQAQFAANALLWQAWQYLENNSATNTDRVYGDVPRFYSAAVVKCARMILPGFTLRVQYDAWRDGLHAIQIDRDVWITAVTRSIGGDGVYVAALELATVPRAAEDDNVLIARNLIRLGKLASHNTAEGY